MKTKEEIVIQAKEYAESIGNKDGTSAYHYVVGYTKCQEDMAKISEWQLCPKCFGEGQVSNVGTSSSTYRNCPVCNGNKILIKPYENKQD